MKEIDGGVVFVPDVLTDRGEPRRMKHSLCQREFKCVMNSIVSLHECVTVRRQELFLSIGGAEALSFPVQICQHGKYGQILIKSFKLKRHCAGPVLLNRCKTDLSALKLSPSLTRAFICQLLCYLSNHVLNQL